MWGMSDFQSHFKGKKITAMGLGLLGRGVGDISYMAEAGAAEIIVTDLKTEEELAPSVEQLKQYDNVRFVLGEHRNGDFAGRDFILVAAGVPQDSPYLAVARGANVPLKQSAALFAELSKVPIIGITGTRGKSTVTMMIHHVLQFVTGEEILLGGNIRGVSNLQLLHKVQDDSLCVMELDSWQLQGWGWAGISPQVAVFTSFMPDHLNYYCRTSERSSGAGSDTSERGTAASSAYQKGDMSREEGMTAYFTDKAQIFLHQEDSGTFITTPAVFEQLKHYLPRVTLGNEVILADASLIPEDAHLAMPGEHNRLNAALAYKALEAVGLTEQEIFDGLATFPGVEGRLQLVKTVDNVRIYNDNNATTPAATKAALEALDLGNQNVILIAGGEDKGLDPAELAYAITQHCKRVILTPGSGTEKLLELIHNNDIAVTVVENLEQAVTEAKLGAENADIILFSPAFASFAQYKNEYERNDAFIELVEKL
jgi:UDP-N-acetylmuramoylalanine--D-glutamate ligase